MKNVPALMLAVSLFFPSVAWADDPLETPPEEAAPLERPSSSGVGYLVAGGIFTGLGVLNLVTAPLCKTSAIAPSIQDGCLIASLALGGTFFVIGVPLLIVGGVKRGKYKAWKAQNAMSPAWPGPWGAPRDTSSSDWTFGAPAPAGVGFSLAKDGGMLTLGGQF